MPIRIVKQTENNNSGAQDIKDYAVQNEKLIRQLFSLCHTIVNQIAFVMENIDMQKMMLMNDVEFDAEMQRFIKIMDIFGRIVGAKTSILDALGEAVKIIVHIQKVAADAGIDLTKGEGQEVDVSEFDENKVQELALLVRNLGIDEICKNYNNRVKEFEEQNSTFNYNNDADGGGNQQNYDVEQEEERFREAIAKSYKENDNKIFYITKQNKTKN